MPVSPLTQIDANTFAVYFPKEFYEREAIFHAAYKFQSLFFITIEPYKNNHVCVTLTAKDSNSTASDSKLVVQEFYNEVIDQQLRLDIKNRTENIRSYIYQKAFSPLISLKEQSK